MAHVEAGKNFLSRIQAEKPAPFAAYAARPVEFVEEVLGLALTPAQKAIALSLLSNRETNVPAAHGVGKTLLAAALSIWWTTAVGGLFISTAPTERQVTQLLWGEIRKLYDRHRSKFGGSRGQTFLRITENFRGYGFTARANSTNSFQGIHHGKLLIILDEANEISQEIDDGAASCASGSENRILRIGNPDCGGTPFAEHCKLSQIKVPCWEHPNIAWAYEPAKVGDRTTYRLKTEVAAVVLERNGTVKPQNEWPDWCPRDKIPGAVSIAWVEKQRRRGENSAYWIGRLDAEFPESVGNSIIPTALFDECRRRYDENPIYWDNIGWKSAARYGLDVGDGIDKHAIAAWHGPILYRVEEKACQGDRLDVGRAADWAWAALVEFPGVVNVDRLGVGAGALTQLKRWLGHSSAADLTGEFYRDEDRSSELKGVCTALGCAYSGKAEGLELTEDFVLKDCKAEYFFELREAMRRGEIAIAPLGEAEAELRRELSLIFYEEMPGGGMRIEPKAKSKKRLGRSPDLADAVVMGYNADERAIALPDFW